MSMISAQIDELRRMADGQATYRDARAVMLQAADTIWELRDDLQRANAENAKLREERDMYRDLVGCMVHPDIPDQLAAENAKLRELVADMWDGYNDPRCEECHLKDTPTCADCPVCAREALVIDRMRELGIEVDG